MRLPKMQPLLVRVLCLQPWPQLSVLENSKPDGLVTEHMLQATFSAWQRCTGVAGAWGTLLAMQQRKATWMCCNGYKPIMSPSSGLMSWRKPHCISDLRRSDGWWPAACKSPKKHTTLPLLNWIYFRYCVEPEVPFPHRLWLQRLSVVILMSCTAPSSMEHHGRTASALMTRAAFVCPAKRCPYHLLYPARSMLQTLAAFFQRCNML